MASPPGGLDLGLERQRQVNLRDLLHQLLDARPDLAGRGRAGRTPLHNNQTGFKRVFKKQSIGQRDRKNGVYVYRLARGLW